MIYRLSVLLLVMISQAPSATAHVLQQQSDIGAVIHIEPNDRPVAVQSNAVFFEIKDRTGMFDPVRCDCTVLVVDAKERLISTNQTTLRSSGTTVTLGSRITFPETGLYTVRLSGQPTAENLFSGFTLDFPVEVTRQATEEKLARSLWYHLAHYSFIALVPILFVILGLRGELTWQQEARQKKLLEENSSTRKT